MQTDLIARNDDLEEGIVDSNGPDSITKSEVSDLDKGICALEKWVVGPRTGFPWQNDEFAALHKLIYSAAIEKEKACAMLYRHFEYITSRFYKHVMNPLLKSALGLIEFDNMSPELPGGVDPVLKRPFNNTDDEPHSPCSRADQIKEKELERQAFAHYEECLRIGIEKINSMTIETEIDLKYRSDEIAKELVLKIKRVCEIVNLFDIYNQRLLSVFSYLDRYHIALAGSDSLKVVTSRVWVQNCLSPYIDPMVDIIVAALALDRKSELDGHDLDDSIPLSQSGLPLADYYQSASFVNPQLARLLGNLNNHIINLGPLGPARLTVNYKSKVIEATRRYYDQVAREWTQSPILYQGEDEEIMAHYRNYLYMIARLSASDERRCIVYLGTDIHVRLQNVITESLVIGAIDYIREGIPSLVRSLMAKLADWDINALFNCTRTYLLDSPGQNTATSPCSILSLLYHTISRCEHGIQQLSVSLRKIMSEDCQTAISLYEVSPLCTYEMITELFTIARRYEIMIDFLLDSDFALRKQLTESLVDILRSRVGGTVMSENVSRACELLIRKTICARLHTADSIDALPQDEETVMTHVQGLIYLFTCVPEKEEFFDSLRQRMSKRLIGSHEPINATEMALITGFERTSPGLATKVVGIIDNVNENILLKSQFDAFMAQSGAEGEVVEGEGVESEKSRVRNSKVLEANRALFDEVNANAAHCSLTSQILRSGVWPDIMDTDFAIPAIIRNFQQLYEKWYLYGNDTRRLKWKPQLSTAQLQFGDYTVSCNGIQASILTTFSQPEEFRGNTMSQADVVGLSAMDIAERLDTDSRVVDREISTFLVGHKILTLVEGSLVNKKTDAKHSKVYTVNTAFTYPSTHFKLVSPLDPVDRVDEQKAVVDHSLAIHSRIMRILKRAKRLDESKVVSDTIAELNAFCVSESQVRSGVEHLLSKDYIEKEGSELVYA